MSSFSLLGAIVCKPTRLAVFGLIDTGLIDALLCVLEEDWLTNIISLTTSAVPTTKSRDNKVKNLFIACSVYDQRKQDTCQQKKVGKKIKKVSFQP